METLKKAVIASFGVQCALASIGLLLYLLPSQYGQNGVLVIFPFVLGVQLGPMLLRPLVGVLSPDVQMNLAIISSLVGNFIVYAVLFYAWFAFRKQFSTNKHLPSLT
jgi:hypothetical protein